MYVYAFTAGPVIVLRARRPFFEERPATTKEREGMRQEDVKAVCVFVRRLANLQLSPADSGCGLPRASFPAIRSLSRRGSGM